MRVSVIIATHNGEAYIAETIDSLLAQSRPPEQIIVVDDGSRDGTAAVLKQFGGKIEHLSQSNRGQAAAVNRGIAACNGDVLGFLDHDDLWCPDKLALQLEILRTDSRLDAVFGLIRQFVSPELPEQLQREFKPDREILNGETKICMLIRRSAFDRIGLFDERLPATFFIEWLGRAKSRGFAYAIPEKILALRRLHRGNGRRVMAIEQHDETLQALKQIIDNKRAQR
jgi:glycosyltransferase involved in cell wall biosynthesis